MRENWSSRVRGKVDRVEDVIPTHLMLRESTAMAKDR